jgi:pyruvate,water dikinase
MNDKEIKNSTDLIKRFSDISLSDISLVGGKNASLGELYNQLTSKGVNVPNGFATTTHAYWKFLDENNILHSLTGILNKLDKQNFANLRETGMKARELILNGKLPEKLSEAIRQEYTHLYATHSLTEVAVRSSATAEDLPTASFAGQHESFLNIKGEEQLLDAVHKCFASLFTDRAIKYREDHHFDHLKVALSVGIQKMVRSDLASSGIAFTIEPESGFKDIIHISGSWGLGENIVQGAVNADEYYVFKPTFILGKNAIISKKMGTKAKTMVYSEKQNHDPEKSIYNIDTPVEKQRQFVLTNSEINKIATWCLLIEQHYGKAMDIEWAKDGLSGELFIVQARPETVHSGNQFIFQEYKLTEKGAVITTGNAVGNKIASGVAKVLKSPAESDKIKPGDVLVTEMTNPDWDPILKKVAALVTSRGGRTSHASIVARELGVVAVVGASDALEKIQDGQSVTVSCAEGNKGVVYNGQLHWENKEIDFASVELPATSPMMILSDPDKAFKLSFYPNNGVGLMRLEFIINNAIQIHPMALVKFDSLKDVSAKVKIEQLTYSYPDKKHYFIDKLSQAIATIAAAFYPKEVIVRMSDFKTNEYSNLIGGKEFEPLEENPMIGFRGASRYFNERYKEGFLLECEAMKNVRENMGFTNVKLMIPFCRTIEEGKKVIQLMADNGLKRNEKGLEIYMMVEIPSNVILADEFAKIVDGFSIGSNDLTQLTLGIDRDSDIISESFDEQNEAVKKMIIWAILAAKKNGIKIGLCGQAPSDHPEFATFLVRQHIDSISFNPDALLNGIENITKAEKEIAAEHRQPGFMVK